MRNAGETGGKVSTPDVKGQSCGDPLALCGHFRHRGTSPIARKREAKVGCIALRSGSTGTATTWSSKSIARLIARRKRRTPKKLFGSDVRKIGRSKNICKKNTKQKSTKKDLGAVRKTRVDLGQFRSFSFV